jgi:hypothetical protein
MLNSFQHLYHLPHYAQVIGVRSDDCRIKLLLNLFPPTSVSVSDPLFGHF